MIIDYNKIKEKLFIQKIQKINSILHYKIMLIVENSNEKYIYFVKYNKNNICR